MYEKCNFLFNLQKDCFLFLSVSFRKGTAGQSIVDSYYFKGSLTGDFQLQVFFMNQCPPGPWVRIPWGPFQILSKICGDIHESMFCGGSYLVILNIYIVSVHCAYGSTLLAHTAHVVAKSCKIVFFVSVCWAYDCNRFLSNNFRCVRMSIV